MSCPVDIQELATFSIVIPTRLRAPLLARTLDSLASQTGTAFDVVVVCDGEDPATRQLSEKYFAAFPLTWIFTAENNGQAAARNTGARAARNTFLLFLDDDTTAAPGYIFHHLKSHRFYSDVKNLVVFGPIAETYARDPTCHTDRLLREARIRYLERFYSSAVQKGIYSVGSDAYRFKSFGLNCSVKRALFTTIGGFDPRLRTIEEDMELGSRLYDQGVRFVFEPAAKVYHNDTTDLVKYSTSCWKLEGPVLLYRVLEKNQRNPQTSALALWQRSARRTLKAFVCWKFPSVLRTPARILRQITDATGSRASYWLWMSATCSVEFWQGVKSEGINLKCLRQIAGAPVTVLGFHSISESFDLAERDWSFSPDRFRRFAKLLAAAGYSFQTPAEAFSGSAAVHSIVLTFDDGYEDFYSEVFPDTATLGLKPTVFVVVDCIGGTNTWGELAGRRTRKLLSLSQIREMHLHGVEFGSHTLSHPSLPMLDDRQLRREVSESKTRLENLLGSEVTCFAYPFGELDIRVRAAVAEAGYRFAFSTHPGLNLWEDPFCLKRLEIRQQDTSFGLMLKLATGRTVEEDIAAFCRRTLRAGMELLPKNLSRILRHRIARARTRSAGKAR